MLVSYVNVPSCFCQLDTLPLMHKSNKLTNNNYCFI